ncbi:2Fe-2S iron-sulfur cluster-binding protein [Vibrio sonorensis]|uniref:2Fe-2S iron-sulfur cluster-binding protein n=1 Tax=Vibrio sonorensis TaxID=1004316 RepID=UPI0008DA353D|nr:2Fe-2S iron-sulfur cluster-binding protein [Vibrio sonorensis]
MSFTVTLLPKYKTFKVESGQTVLEAALSNNIPFPNRCQIGACAACLCRKIEGKVTYHLEPMLTEKEQEQGWVFACQAFAESNLLLTLEE